MRITFLCLLICLFSAAALGQSGFVSQSYDLPHHETYLVSGDLNRDGKPDLVLFTNHPAVMLNNGDGTFAAPVVIDSNIFNMQNMQVADFNNDGIPDLVGCGFDLHENLDLIIYLNDGAGNFTPSETIKVPTCPALQVGDVDGDGNQDVITGFITVYAGDGTGHLPRSFGQSVNVDPTQHPEITGCSVQSLRAADFVGDGLVHVLITGVCTPVGQATSSYGTLYFGQNDGAGHFTLSEVTESNVWWTLTGVVADVDGDGRLDALMTHTLQAADGSQKLLALDVAFNQGGGNFQVIDMFNLDATNNPDTTGVGSGAAADFDIDGLPDIVVAFQDAGASFIDMVDAEAIDNWTITDQWDPGGRVFAGIIAGDFNGDGLPDIAVIATHTTGPNTLIIYLGIEQ